MYQTLKNLLKISRDEAPRTIEFTNKNKDRNEKKKHWKNGEKAGKCSEIRESKTN